MKKYFAAILALILVFAMTGCGKAASNSASAIDEMTLEEIMDSILTDVTDLPNVASLELTDDNFEVYAFVAPKDGVTGLVSEALIGSIAHSVVLLRAATEEDAAELAKEVEANANPRKWICVEAEKTIVKTQGCTVVLIMSFEKTADEIAANFDKLAK